MKHFSVVNLSAIDKRFQDGETVTSETLAKLGLIRDTKLPLKVLGHGELTKKSHRSRRCLQQDRDREDRGGGGSANVAE